MEEANEEERQKWNEVPGHPLCFKLGLEATACPGDSEDEVLRPRHSGILN